MDNFRELLNKLDEMADEISMAMVSDVQEADDDPDNDPDTGEIMVGDYQTRHFDMCPAATALYGKMEDADELAQRSAKLQDVLYYMEKDPDRKHVPEDGVMAETLADVIMMMAEMMDMESEHDYIQGHVDAIKAKVGEE